MEIKILEARDKGQFLSLEMAAIFANLRKSQVALHLEHKVEILNANQQINQLLRNSFQWFHEDSLPMDAINIVPPTRLQVNICSHHYRSRHFAIQKKVLIFCVQFFFFKVIF